MKNIWLSSVLAKFLIGSVVFVGASSGFSQVSIRKPIDPKSAYAKLVGEGSQVNGGTLVGNGIVIGSGGCHIVTNFHVAYGKSKDKSTGEVELVDDLEIGHTVNFDYDLDSKTGKFQKRMKAKVIEFGNYEAGTSRGLLGDIAVLRLENCLGKQHAGPELDRPEPTKRFPTGSLMTLSTSRDGEGKSQILVQDGCRSEGGTPITGMLLSNCEVVPGMSGSMVLEKGSDGKMRLVGLSVMHSEYKDGTKVSLAIYSSVLSKFIDDVIGRHDPVTARKAIDPKSPYAKIVGEVSQISGGTLVGNGFVVGPQACHIVTNFHIAYGKSKNKSTGEVELVDDLQIGHTVNFDYDLDTKTGRFQKTMKAKVVEFGNYQAGTTRGFLGDVAVLRLENCLGKQYAGPELDRPEPTKRFPTGSLVTISTTRDAQGKSEILAQDDCRSEEGTPLTGMLVPNCEILPGMSGSMVLEKGADGKMRLVGLATKNSEFKDGTKVSLAIYSKVLTKFIENAIGEKPGL